MLPLLATVDPVYRCDIRDAIQENPQKTLDLGSWDAAAAVPGGGADRPPGVSAASTAGGVEKALPNCGG